MRTDKNGRATVEFYTSDEPGDYMVFVEGFADDASRGTATFLFSVEGSTDSSAGFK